MLNYCRDVKGGEARRPFQYRFEHDGSLYGFTHALGGTGLEDVSTDFYKLIVDNEGTAQVAVNVSAEEQRRDPPEGPQVIEKVVIKKTCHCSLVGARSTPGQLTVAGLLFAVFGLGVLVRRSRRRRQRRG